MRIQEKPDTSDTVTVPDRARAWSVTFLRRTGGHVESVLLRNCIADLKPGEDITDWPPTLELTPGEWAVSHADYGLDAKGQPL